MHASFVETRGQQEGVDDNKNQAPVLTCLSKYNALNNDIKEQLHSCYHLSNLPDFQQIALGLMFTLQEITFLKIYIKTNNAKSGCHKCIGGNDHSEKYKCIEQQNCDKIHKYFNETLSNIIQTFHQQILQEYKTKSNAKFQLYKLNSNNVNNIDKMHNLEIKLKSINNELTEVLTNCYSIIDHDIPFPPKIQIKETNLFNDDLKILIIDNDTKMNDKYEMLLNNNTVIPFNDMKYDQHELNINNETKPLLNYSISVRRHVRHQNKWSEYSEPLNINTGFKCIWSRIKHGKNMKFTQDYKYISCKANRGDCTILCNDKYVMSAAIFKQIAFCFRIEQIAQLSYFGFIEHPSGVNVIKNWDSLLNNNEYTYCLGCNAGSNEIQRYIQGKPRGIKKWSGWSSSIKLKDGYKIKNGDLFIFVINFEEMNCNVFVNEIINKNKISVDNEYTFDGIPDRLIPFYCHQHNQYSLTNSTVSVEIYDTNYTYKVK